MAACAFLLWAVAASTVNELSARDFEESLRFEARVYAALYPTFASQPQTTLDALSTASARITLTDADGNVRFDSAEPVERVAPLSDRPEILQARSHGTGEAVRVSQSTGALTRFVAIAVHDQGELVGFARAARAVEVRDARTREQGRELVLSLVLVVIAFAGVAALVARACVRPLGEVAAVAAELAAGRVTKRLPTQRTDEIGLLSRHLNEFAQHTDERIEAEQHAAGQLASILAGLTEGVLAIDKGQRIIHMNDAARKMLTDGDASPVGQTLWDVVRFSEIIEAVDACFRDLNTVRLNAEINGKTYDTSVIVLRDASLEGVGAIVVMQDVTEVRRLEKVRTEFVANASHELKTPIAAVKGFAETIVNDPDMPEETKDRFLERIRVQAGRIENLVQELIALSRFDAPGERTSGTRVDFVYLVRQVFQNKREDAADAGVELSLETPDRPLELDGDAEALSQLVINLIDNAIKYVGEGGTVIVRLYDLSKNAVLEVEDNGIGIAPEEHDRIFERFYRVDKARSAEQGGTGLGLSIVKHIAQSHDGSVGVESSLGRGSIFTVKIPLLEAGTAMVK